MKYSNRKIPEGINTSEVHPVKEFVLLTSGIIAVILGLIFVLGTLLDWSSQFIPFRYEQQIAQPIVAQFTPENTLQNSIGNDLIDDYLQSLADDITPLMALTDDMAIRVHYVNDETVNGMATLGGHLFIFRGLLEKLPSENALVMLLAHEIAHVKLRHPIKSLSKGVLISLLLATISGQSSSDITGFVSGTSQLAFLGFSRSQEQAADNEAIALSNQYYQHTQGATELFTVLLAESEKSSFDAIGLFRSHPEVLERLAIAQSMSVVNDWQQQGQVKAIPKVIIDQVAIDKDK